jgi:hypothetical protein
MAFDPIDAPGNTRLTYEKDGETRSIEEIPDLAEFFELLRPVQDPLAILSFCEMRDEEEGWPKGTALEYYLQEIRCTH